MDDYKNHPLFFYCFIKQLGIKINGLKHINFKQGLKINGLKFGSLDLISYICKRKIN